MPGQTAGNELVLVTPADVLPPAPPELLPPDFLTDMGNSRSLVAAVHREIRWVPGLGWMFWDNKRWQQDEGDVYVNNAARRVILALRTAIEQDQDNLTESERAAWRKEGLKNTPSAILEATAAYRKDSDPMAEWLEDCVLVEDGAKVRIQAVRDSYANHCQDAGRMPVGVTRFNAGLERLGAVRRAGRDEFNKVAKMWFGLRLKSGLTDT